MDRLGLRIVWLKDALAAEKQVKVDKAAAATVFNQHIELKNERLRKITADRDGANRAVARFAHNAAELTLLRAAIREAGPKVAEKVHQIFERISGGKLGSADIPHAKLDPEKEVREAVKKVNDGKAIG